MSNKKWTQNLEDNRLAEQSIYDFFLDELFSLEKYIYMFVEKSDEIEEEKLALEKTIKNLTYMAPWEEMER